MAVEIDIWNDNPGPVSGSTPFGYYDDEQEFVTDCKKFAKFGARRLGYPIVDVELQSGSFYSAMEEAVMEYAFHVNNSKIKDNLLSLKGTKYTSSLTQKNISQNLNYILSIADQYGTEAGVGGNVSWKTGSIDIKEGVQRYNLDELFRDQVEPGEEIEIRRIFHQAVPSSIRYYDPYLNTDGSNSFGFNDSTVYSAYLLYPLYQEALIMNQIEMNDKLRRSSYSFRLINNNLVLFPVPESDGKLHFEYLVKSEKNHSVINEDTSSISDYSNIPYDRISYSNINDVGKNWIRKYALAISKQMLGLVRSKYSNIPIPESDVTLNGDTLISESENEIETLVQNLKDMLEQLSNEKLLERRRNESEYSGEEIDNIPLKIYMG